MVPGLVRAIRLPHKSLDNETHFERTFVFGYGIVYVGGTGRSNGSPRRDGFQFSEMSVETCNQTFGFESDAHICTSSGSIYTSKCFGQAGGPLVTTDKEGPILIGVAHFLDEYGCIVDNPTVFTRVRYYLWWIKTVTNENKEIFN